MPSLVLGLNAPIIDSGRFTFDGSVALLRDGRPVVAIAEERVSRQRYDGDFRRSLAAVAERYAITPKDLAGVAVTTFGQPAIVPARLRDRLAGMIADTLGGPLPIEFVPSHHEAHALCALGYTRARDALVVVLDNTGSLLEDSPDSDLPTAAAEQTSYFLYRNNSLTLIARDHAAPGAVGYGRAYSKVTRYSGFASYQESGKTMALAAFGDPAAYTDCDLYFSDAGREETALEYESISSDGFAELQYWFARRGHRLHPARVPHSVVRRHDMDLCCWIQEQIHASIGRRIAALVAEHQVQAVCLAGGVALNSTLAMHLQQRLGDIPVETPPSPGDSGLALGAAAWWVWTHDRKLSDFGDSPYLGLEFSDDDVARSFDEAGDLGVDDCRDPCGRAAESLAAGRVVAWFHGRSEHGPRALGNRSILAAPRPWVRETINHQVKGREWFRPFAPAARREEADRFFAVTPSLAYMMKGVVVNDALRHRLPGCLHVDGTARLQVVTAEINARFHRLLTAYGTATGTPVLLNTSFNLARMPIVETPGDAIRCFRDSHGIDELYIDNHVLTKDS